MSTTLAPRKPSVPTASSVSSRLTKPTASSANRISRNAENNGATHNKPITNTSASSVDVVKPEKPKVVKKAVATSKPTTTVNVLTPSSPAVTVTDSARTINGSLGASKTVTNNIAPTAATSVDSNRVSALQETIDNLKRELTVAKLAAHAATVDAKRYEEKLREIGIDTITLRLIAPVDMTDEDTNAQRFVRTQTRSRYVSESVRHRPLSALRSPLNIPPPAATPFNTPRPIGTPLPGSTQRRHHTSVVMTPGVIPPMSEETSVDLDDGVIRVPLGSFLIGTEALANERYSLGSNISMVDRSFTDAEIMAAAF